MVERLAREALLLPVARRLQPVAARRAAVRQPAESWVPAEPEPAALELVVRQRVVPMRTAEELRLLAIAPSALGRQPIPRRPDRILPSPKTTLVRKLGPA